MKHLKRKSGLGGCSLLHDTGKICSHLLEGLKEHVTKRVREHNLNEFTDICRKLMEETF